jgi:PilZ domain-containing protein
VLIAAPDLMAALKERTATNGGELLAFTDSDALRALDVITKRRPAMVALERAFAATPRGAALINRIKSDPTLTHSEIRVVSHDTELPRVPPPPAPDVSPPPMAASAEITAEAEPLDTEGTRRTERFTMATGVQVLLDGSPVALIDLSGGGAQVVSPTVLKPNQRVRIAFSDDRGILRVTGIVLWATFEIPPSYRAGLEFIDADSVMIHAYAIRHQA